VGEIDFLRAQENSLPDPPAASVNMRVVQQLEPGVYGMHGAIRDRYGDFACGLALASGQCMFSCGPWSQFCDGEIGPEWLRVGEFFFTNLRTEIDGSIRLQAFVESHTGFNYSFDPKNLARWNVQNQVCCEHGPSIVSVSLDGMINRAFIPSCDEYTSESTAWPFLGMLSLVSPGEKTIRYSLEAPDCALKETGTYTSSEWVTDGCYMIVVSREGGSVVVADYELLGCYVVTFF
jgi:hypothetical protein